jgi:hypothetical protein
MTVKFAIKFFNGFNEENPLLGNLAVISEIKDKEDYMVKLFNINKLSDV